MSDVTIAAIATGLVGVIGGIASAYVLIYSSRITTESRVKDDEAKRRTAEREQERSEFKELYEEMKRRWSDCTDEHKRSEKRVRRLELACLKAGIALPELVDDGSSEAPKLETR